jgi:hypothetical protein
MSEGECVKVVVRCRPANSREKELKSAKIVRIDRRALAISLVKGGAPTKRQHALVQLRHAGQRVARMARGAPVAVQPDR